MSDSQMEDIASTFDSHDIPYSVGTHLLSGTQFNTIVFENEESRFEFASIPTTTTQTVKDEPVKIDYNAVFVDNSGNRAALVEHEDELNLPFLPDLRQAFYEGESFKERDADYRYHFSDGTDEIAVDTSDPVGRLDDQVEIVGIEYMGGFAPRKWLLETSDDKGLYLRERSGSIRLYDSVEGDNQIFNAYIGGEHPGTPVVTQSESEDVYNAEDDEVLQIISAVNYINIVDSPRASVSEHIREAYDDYLSNLYDRTEHQSYNRSFEEIYDDIDIGE